MNLELVITTYKHNFLRPVVNIYFAVLVQAEFQHSLYQLGFVFFCYFANVLAFLFGLNFSSSKHPFR